jgi:hypothetical protein
MGYFTSAPLLSNVTHAGISDNSSHGLGLAFSNLKSVITVSKSRAITTDDSMHSRDNLITLSRESDDLRQFLRCLKHEKLLSV